MLSVSFDLAVVAAMLIGIFVTGRPTEVDSLNSPTTRPIPCGSEEVGVVLRFVKGLAGRGCGLFEDFLRCGTLDRGGPI